MIEQCKNCFSTNIEFKQSHLLYNIDTDEEEYKEGYVCNDCGCFHSEIEDFYQYDSYPNKEAKVNFIKTDYEVAKDCKPKQR